MITKCKWIKINNKPCCNNSISNKNYCKLHKKFEGVFFPNDLSKIKWCSRCKKPLLLNYTNTKCDTCIKNQEKQKKDMQNKRNQNKKKCEWVNQNGKPCPWKTLESNLYCKRHSKYENLFKPDDIQYLKRCSGCKNLFKYIDKKTCENCIKRNIEKTKIAIASRRCCIAIIKHSNKQCLNSALENDDYCMKHQRVKKYNELTNQNFKICKNWIRGCFHKLSENDISYCKECKFSKNNNKNTKLNIQEEKYNTYKSEANRRKISWELSKEHCNKLFKNNCYYCGINNGLNGIDRMNSKLSYNYDNCVSCCSECNKMKLTHSVEKFIKIIECLAVRFMILDKEILYNNVFNNINGDVFQRCKNKMSYKSYKTNSIKRKVKFNITQTQYNNILTYPCYYCDNFKDSGAWGIDRLLSDLPYQIDNIVPCCKTCNLLKGVFTPIQFKQKVKNIYKCHILKQTPDYQTNPKNKLITILSKNNIKITSYPQLKLSKPKDYYESLIFNGTYSDICNIRLKLEFVDSTNKELFEIWQYYRKTISSFKTKKGHCLFGKRIYVLVKDENSNTYLGILSISSDIKFIGERDKYIGWGKQQQFKLKKIDNLVNITTCVSTQPFGYNFNGGKLLTSLAFSKEILEFYYNKYNTQILGITTMSLYGKSIQYDRLKCLKYLGLTKGNSLKNIPQQAIKFAKQYLKNNNLLTDSLYKNNLWALKKCLNHMKIPVEDVLKSTPKGIYFGFTSPESKKYLCSNTSENLPNPIKYAQTANNIFNWWRERWAKQRFNHLKNQNKLH